MSPRAAVALLAAFVLLTGWYVIASGYNYNDLAGTYVFEDQGARCILQLSKDRSFSQELRVDTHSQQAFGEWRRIGEGGVNFSPTFLRVPGAKTFIEVQPDHPDGSDADKEFYGHFERVLGLFPTLYLEGSTNPPVFHKKYF